MAKPPKVKVTKQIVEQDRVTLVQLLQRVRDQVMAQAGKESAGVSQYGEDAHALRDRYRAITKDDLLQHVRNLVSPDPTITELMAQTMLDEIARKRSESSS